MLGHATAVTGADEKLRGLEAFSRRLLPGRWADARPPTATELKATSILRIPLDEASAKIRTGPPRPTARARVRAAGLGTHARPNLTDRFGQ